jgi:hypothetical protein
MRVRRDVSAIPLRAASETWDAIVDLVTGPGSRDVCQLRDAVGVMGSIIADEHPANCAVVLEGVGAQLRIYCRYGMKAIEEGAKVDPLTWNPTAGEWSMRVPCDADNIAWVRASLARTSARIKVFNMADEDWSPEESSGLAANGNKNIVVDWDLRG